MNKPVSGGNVLRQEMLYLFKPRVAGPSNNLEALIPFYCDGLGFDVLYEFRDHAGFDGVMLGHVSAPQHFEFTHARGHFVTPPPATESLLVFYIPETHLWLKAAEGMAGAGFEPVDSYNPFWELRGLTFEDPGGYRIVLQNDEWST